MNLNFSVRKKTGPFTFEFKGNFSKNHYGVYGPSGSGKTTLISILAGLITPDEGFIQFNDRVLFDSDRGTNLRPENRRIGVVFQHAHLFPHLSVRKNLQYGYARTKREERIITPERIIHLLDLEPLIDRSIANLSGGERQRVALGRTILTSPHLLLLDEPLSGIDISRKNEITERLGVLFEETSIPFLLVSHSHEEIVRMTQDVIIIDQGSTISVLSSNQLVSDTNKNRRNKSEYFAYPRFENQNKYINTIKNHLPDLPLETTPSRSMQPSP